MLKPKLYVVVFCFCSIACYGIPSPDDLGDAAAKNDVTAINALVDQGAPVDGLDRNGNTPLMRAAFVNRVEAIRALIARGANVNFYPASGGSALTTAIAAQMDGAALELIANGANVTIGPKGEPPLVPATSYGRLEVVKALLQAGAKATCRDSVSAETPLHYGAVQNADICKLLIASGADIESRGDGGRTALQEAAQAGNLDTMRLLIAAGGKIENRDDKGRTALFWAVLGDKPEAIRLLLAKGANINERDLVLGATPLITAASSYGRESALRVLIDAGALVNLKTRTGYTALDLADALHEGRKIHLLEVAGAKHAKDLSPQ